MKMIKRLVGVVVFALVLVAAGIIYLSVQTTREEEIQTVTKGDISKPAIGIGVIEGSSEPATLRFGRPGHLSAVNFREGDHVLDGDVIAELSSNDMDLQISQAESEVKQREKDVEARTGQLSNLTFAQATEKHEKAKADVQAARERLDALKNAVPLPPSPEAIEDAELKVKEWGLKLELAKAELEKLKGSPPTSPDVKAADAKASLAELELKRSEQQLARLKLPPVPQRAPEEEIRRAEDVLTQASSRENEAGQLAHRLKNGSELAEIDSLKAIRDKAKKQLEQLQLQRQGLKLVAPFDGLVIKRIEEPNTIVPAFAPIMTVVDFRKKRVRAEFDIAWLGKVEPGMKAIFTSKAFKDATGAELKLEGKVIQVGKVGARRMFLDDPSASKGGEVVEVTMSVDEPDGEVKKAIYKNILRPNLRVEAKVVLEERSDVIRAPKSFVSEDNDKSFVWIVETNPATNKTEAPKKRYVKRGLYDDAYVEIIEGLNIGDQIAKPKPQNR